MQTFFQTEIHKILTPATTRWLSLKACVDRVLEQYPALKSYFRLECFDDPSKTTDTINASLNNSFTKVYLEFMSYVLELLNDFNIMFQSETALLHKLKPETEKLIKTLAANYMELSHYNNPRLYVPINKVYIGISAQETIHELQRQPNPPQQSDIDRARLDCMQFYIEAIKQIITRFDFPDSYLFNILPIVEPATSTDYKTLVKEWREYCLMETDAQISNDLPDISGNIKYPNIRKFIGMLLVLPFANASVERTAKNSKLKRIKTESRTRLNTNTIVSLMATSSGIKDVVKFEPTKDMLEKKLKY
ncbi:hypothetical protein ABMA27_008957 [Loxostege sticticalis]|uniref:HAT C-terminal dimerisation domain-containing protein n=1 Tax=Loxostege sticticalis TaxID=481309 RepID=A0ABR3H9E3_LOXSC